MAQWESVNSGSVCAPESSKGSCEEGSKAESAMVASSVPGASLKERLLGVPRRPPSRPLPLPPGQGSLKWGYGCENCRLRFARPAQLRAHKCHKPATYSCKRCRRNFIARGPFRQHKCDISRLRISASPSLSNDEISFLSPIASSSAASSDNDAKSSSPRRRSNLASLKGRRLLDTLNPPLPKEPMPRLSLHKRLQSRQSWKPVESEIECGLCGAGCESELGLRKHERAHHNPGILAKHAYYILDNGGEPNGRQVTCSECRMRVDSAGALDAHRLRVHNPVVERTGGEKGGVCVACGTRLACLDAVQRHVGLCAPARARLHSLRLLP